jgi:hypothetical protein
MDEKERASYEFKIHLLWTCLEESQRAYNGILGQNEVLGARVEELEKRLLEDKNAN